MFPVHWKDAVTMSLCNEPSFHYKPLSKAEVERKLKVDGDFLIHRAEYDERLILCVRNDEVQAFLIFLRKSSSTNFIFCIGEAEFPSFDCMIDYLKTSGITREDGELFNFSRIVKCMNAFSGRFGAEFKRDLRPRSNLTDPTLNSMELKVPCRLVALRKEISAMELHYELKNLGKLSHENLISLLDYEIYGSHSINRLVILRNQWFDDNLFDHLRYSESVPLKSTAKWIKQAADAMQYLDEVKAYTTIVCAQDSFLDADGNLKIGGAWVGRWPTMLEDSVRDTFYWRFCSPDFLQFEDASWMTLLYNWAVFSWQIATSCLVVPFSEYVTPYDYMNDRYYLYLPLPFMSRPHPTYREELEDVRTVVNLCTRLPDKLNSLITEGVDQQLGEKRTFDKLVLECQTQYKDVNSASDAE